MRETPGARWACFAVSMAGYLALITYILAVNPPLWYDEFTYLEYIPQLHQLGLTTTWLRTILGSAGPLFGLVHAAFEPLTGLVAPGVRLVSIGLAGGSALAIGSALRSRGVPHAFLKAAGLFAVPILYGPIGTAMTEMPAMFFFCVSLALLFPALERAERGDRSAYPLAILAGLACGVATTGRQPYLMATVASVALLGRSTWKVGLLFAISGLVLPVPMFLIWGGLVPPRSQSGEVGISVANCLVAFAYAGVLYSLFDVGWILRRPLTFAVIVAATTAANVATGFAEHYPLHVTAIRNLSPTVLRLYGLTASGVMLGFGVAFVAELARFARDRLDDPADRFVVAATALLLLSTIKNARMFPGRYIATVVPLLLILGVRRAPDTYGKAVRLAVGCILGMISLAAYFKKI
ncbi:MAG TPA: hypothetical protein VGH33_12365 [Isosphaeraceae bacterium]